MSKRSWIKALQKDHPHVILANDPDSPCMVDQWLSTGCMALDWIMGGGLPVGRITELYGDTSTGKSLVAKQAAACALEDGYWVLYIDTERAVSLDIMEALGIDTSQIVYSDPDTIEETFETMESAVDSKPVDQPLLIVWDSIAATTVEEEKAADYDKSHIAVHARAMSKGLRKFNSHISSTNTACLFLNQTRKNIGIMYGDDETTFGGSAPQFYASVSVRMKKGKHIVTKAKEPIGIHTSAYVRKNKVARPFRKAALPIYFDYGIDDAEAALLLLKDRDIIASSGGWYSVNLGGKEIKFQTHHWLDKHFSDNFDEIAKLIFDT